MHKIATKDVCNLLVIAPPGCGKTELLAHRANYLIDQLGKGQYILALTFSNKAKHNLEERLHKILGADRARRYITVRNFHGHAAEIVKSHGLTLGLDVNFSLPTRRTFADVLEEAIEDVKGPTRFDKRQVIERQLREAKNRPLDDGSLLEDLVARSVDPQTIWVERVRQDRGMWFYEDLLRHAQRLLRVPEVARLYRARFGAVLVDEFQDLSSQQLDIALRTSETSRSFVGDPLQGIYSWAGARPVEVERTLRRVSGEPRSLGVSYRSSPNVLNQLGIISEELGGQTLKSNEPHEWFENGIAAGTLLRTGVDEAEFIEKTCRAILTKQPSATIGVICRNAWRRKDIDQIFSSSSLSCKRWDLAMDNSFITELIRVSASRLGGNPSFPELSDDVYGQIENTDVETNEDVALALRQFEAIVEETGSVAAALAQLRTLDDVEEVISPGVHLLNAHTGKGQQFDWVFIPGFEDGNMPDFRAKKKAALDEEKRVLLVMLSRARHGVVLTRAETLISKRTGRPYATTPSRWLPSIRKGLSANGNQLLEHIARLPSAGHGEFLDFKAGSRNVSPATEGDHR